MDDHRFRAVDWNGIELSADRRIGEEIKYAGIRAHDFTVEEGEVNVIPTGRVRISALPFEWYVITECGLWWKIPKGLKEEDACEVIPEHIRIEPDRILLMEE